MATDQHIECLRIRVYEFVPTGDGTFMDVLSRDVSGTHADIVDIVHEIYANLPAHHFAVVCDALPNATISLGYAEPSSQLGESRPEEREGLDTPTEGLARNEKAPGSDTGTHRRPPSWAVENDSEHEEIPADPDKGKRGGNNSSAKSPNTRAASTH